MSVASRERNRGSGDGPSPIAHDELVSILDRGGVDVLNVLERPPTGRLKLIPGSKSMPLSELARRVGELDRRRDVVVYCLNRACNAARRATMWLGHRGFRVRAYEGGIEEWVAARLPTVLDESPRGS